ncbi:hypothetical protein HMPREF9952_1198 [Haemophilus pittmaniae HK 85]|uniref:Uncharacterized protein n=1 Tax=Haemophilus pittmaniae HK 85 TaxID=1035188 RepID=F9Q5R6_9PAST|nr:hypothetical protein HMPREF9952_1198 [Haemophilus pittmaniae HK 85]
MPAKREKWRVKTSLEGEITLESYGLLVKITRYSSKNLYN